MVKKLQKLADKQSGGGMAQLLDGQLAAAIKESAQQIWQAGLGAFSKAQGEGGKVFESLVKEGMSIQRKTQAAAEERLGDVGSRMTKLSDEVQAKAGQQWDRLEAIFEERVAKALGKLGVPRKDDLAALSARVDALGATVARLSKAPAGRKSAAAPATRKAAKSASSKVAAKRATPARRAKRAA